ncbi:hypothetical protein ACHAXT_003323 [Thalassiosira profunda]
MKPTYSENLLYHAGFQFQPRAGEALDIDRIADADIEQIVRETDVATLSTFLDELTFSAIEVHEYSDRTLLKLFRLMQLCLEFLADAQDTLAANLNGLSSKYATKKKDNARLSAALKDSDLTIATLKDKLYHHQQQLAKPCVSSDAPAANEAAASRTDPTLYPVQERRSTAKDPAGLDEISSESSESASKDSTIRIHIVSSTTAHYLQLDVSPGLTVHNLKNKVVARLLSTGTCIDFEKNALFHRGQALTDPCKSLKDCGVATEAALVILPRPVEKETTRSIESKLEALTSAATKSHNELTQATRTLLSTQESSKAALVEAIQAQTTSLESTLREEVQRRANDAALGLSLQQQRAPRQSDVQSPLSKLNIGELVETDGGEPEDDSDAQDPSVEEALPNEAEKAADNQGTLDKPLNAKPTGVALKVDTTAEVFAREVSPFIPPGEIQVHSNVTEDSPQETVSSKDATKESGATSESSTLTYSASSTQPALSTRTPTPTKGYLDRKVPPQEGVFRFSDASIDRLADDASIGIEAAPKITPGRPATDSDMQSIEVSSDANDAGANEPGAAVEKKRGRFGLRKRMPRWRSSKSSGKTKEDSGSVPF